VKTKVELVKGIKYKILDIVEYIPNSIISKSIVKKTTGSITVTAMDKGQELIKRIIPFDSFVQIIDGAVELRIDDTSLFLKSGDDIVIPANAEYSFIANEQFKMITTIIKSGYE
jgi:quercetin dioxygenase-like cupin family protein